MVEISEVVTVDAVLVEAFERLIPQLSTTSAPPARGDLEKLVASDATVLFIASDDQETVGALTLVLMRIPTGIRARIEDVVVDQAAQGQGIGRRLSEAAIARALAVGATTVDLTSRPNRAAANRLYEKLGFQRRDTHVFRLRLPPVEDIDGVKSDV
ncbi:MAG: GNAT family N-acetyltransferase [Acidimicrobiia bacterium]|nr:GNAT family N-acetyltransferase [Acidimicrobiia bacterium]